MSLLNSLHKIFLFGLLLLGGCLEKKTEPVEPEGVRTPLDSFFSPDSQEFAFVLPSLKPVPGVNALTAAECGACHQKHYQDWKQSTHAQALSDLQFQAEITKTDNPRWLCLNCHIPLQDQRKEILVALKDSNVLQPILRTNRNFNPKLRQEAITCAVCHVKQDAQGNSYIISSRVPKGAPHPVKQNTELLQNSCLRCHDPKGEAITPNLQCWFSTQKELTNSQKTQKCHDCHMPEFQGRAAPAFPQSEGRTLHSHSWVGSGIPKTFDGFNKLQSRGFQSGIEVHTYDFGDTLEIQYQNIAGHHLPTGDPEREIVMRLQGFSASKEILIDTLWNYKQIWQWNPARKMADHRLVHGQKHQFKWHKTEKLDSLHFRIWHVRMHSENLKSMKKYPLVDTEDHPGFKGKMQEMEKHYPMARMLHSQSWKSQWLAPLREEVLDSLNFAEKETRLEHRPYEK